MKILKLWNKKRSQAKIHNAVMQKPCDSDIIALSHTVTIT